MPIAGPGGGSPSFNEEKRTRVDMAYRMRFRGKLGGKNQKGVLEKVTRQSPRTTEGQNRDSQEPGEPVSQLPEWDHQELVGESVASCHLVFRHFLKSTAGNVVVAHAAVTDPGVPG